MKPGDHTRGTSYGWPARENMTVEDEERWCLVTFEEHLFGDHLDDGEIDWTSLFVYMRHCGMGPTLDAIKDGEVIDNLLVQEIVLAHYRLPSGRYDLDKVVENFSTQPHIVARIAYLQAENEAQKDHRRKQQRESKRRRRRQRGRQVATH